MNRKYIPGLILLGLMAMGTQARADTCYTYCLGAVQVACESGRIINACVGAWTCEARVGAHECDPGPSECKSDGDCVPGYRCAKPAFGTNWCAQECKDDGDCPSGTDCKKPFGAKFRRCQ